MMSYFSCWHALVMVLFIMVAAEEEENPLLGLLSSRDEVVQIAGYGEEKLSTVLITGSVHCQPPHQPHASPLQGAWVGVKYWERRKGKSIMVAKGVTDEFGEFMIDLPSQFHAIPYLEKVFTVKVRGIPKASLCQPFHHHLNKHKQKQPLILSSFGNGIRTYSAGNITILTHSKHHNSFRKSHSHY